MHGWLAAGPPSGSAPRHPELQLTIADRSVPPATALSARKRLCVCMGGSDVVVHV
jgi:hypothetical protein